MAYDATLLFMGDLKTIPGRVSFMRQWQRMISNTISASIFPAFVVDYSEVVRKNQPPRSSLICAIEVPSWG